MQKDKEKKQKIEDDHMKLIKHELVFFGAPLKRTGSGGYLGHGHKGSTPDYKPGQDSQYKVTN